MWVFKDNWSKEDTFVAVIVLAANVLAIGIGCPELFSYLVNEHNPITQWILALTGILAVYLLYRTLLETRQTLELAAENNEIIRKEQRPWVSLFKNNLPTISYTNKRWLLEFDIEAKNHGKNPATKVVWNAEVWIFSPIEGFPPNVNIGRFKDGLIASVTKETGNFQKTIFPQEEILLGNFFQDLKEVTCSSYVGMICYGVGYSMPDSSRIYTTVETAYFIDDADASGQMLLPASLLFGKGGRTIKLGAGGYGAGLGDYASEHHIS